MKNTSNPIRTIIVSFLIFTPLITKAEDCSKIKNGHFLLIGSSTGIITKIERVDTIQKETVINGNIRTTTIYNVHWLDNCTYTLIPTKEVFEKHPELPIDAVFTVKVTSVTKNIYKQETSCNFSTLTISDEIKILD